MKPRWSGSARRHLREVHDYIARDSKTNAKRMVARIKKAVERLGRSPEAGWVVILCCAKSSSAAIASFMLLLAMFPASWPSTTARAAFLEWISFFEED